MKSYLIKILVLTFIVSFLTFMFYSFLFEEYYLNIIPYVILLFTTVVVLFHIIVTRISKKNISKFTSFFMLSSTLKLFIYIIFIVVYLVFNRQHAMAFIVYFLILYIVYTAFEVIVILPEIKKTSGLSNKT
ncbi:hypothetical protein ACFLQ9_01065 [Bacteroidota bacterium]